MKKLIPFAVAASLALGGCASGGGMSSGAMHNAQDAAAAIKAAEQELAAAKAVDYVWRDTGKMIKKAKAEAKAGKYNKAYHLAELAKRQSINAVAQEKAQKNAGPRY
ncbi:MAG: hypothetical protein P8Z75_02390 [Gammaproteobacteria bacterium]